MSIEKRTSGYFIYVSLTSLNLLLKLYLLILEVLINILLKMTNQIKHKVLLLNDINRTTTKEQQLSNYQKESNSKYQNNKMKKINSNLTKMCITNSDELNTMTKIRRLTSKEEEGIQFVFDATENIKNYHNSNNYKSPLELRKFTHHSPSLLLKSYFVFIIIAITTANTSFGSHYQDTSNKPSIESNSNAVQCK